MDCGIKKTSFSKNKKKKKVKLHCSHGYKRLQWVNRKIKHKKFHIKKKLYTIL